MKLKERRYELVFHYIKEYLLESESDVDTSISANHIQLGVDKTWREATKMADEEFNYSLRQLVHKGYLRPYSRDDLAVVAITQKGVDEWLLPMGGVDTRKIFLSYSTKDKEMATGIKQGLEGLGLYVFMAPDEIEGGAKWLDVIISNLRTCFVFVSLRTSSYARSSASEQECGFALSMGKRILSLCVDTSPSEMGFCADYQGERFNSDHDPLPLIINYCKKQLL